MLRLYLVFRETLVHNSKVWAVFASKRVPTGIRHAVKHDVSHARLTPVLDGDHDLFLAFNPVCQFRFVHVLHGVQIAPLGLLYVVRIC